MNCFYHASTSAVGICKSCGRGLCPECAADIGNGLACKGHCEERAIRINKMIDRNNQFVAVSNTQLRRTMVFGIISGLLFCVLGGAVWHFGDSITGTIFALLGVTFIFRGIASYTKAARYPAE